MKIDSELIKKVAQNARLKLTPAEIKTFTKDFADILEAFKKLDKLKTSGEPVLAQPITKKNVLREDIPKKCLSQQEALKNTKHKQDGYFRGPRAV
ncbi:Asp-tRNA(Asn)/Glu-tRNA(Gln) amidotransferase subunit GatC [Candidatus Woesearchaeota archaeon]|nr:Asp-tRNA(Asn)/Glu-tRNA(Gln) amidotransferase subunit GatC [Candidatus Woesearchaeota archaeon]